MDNALEKLDMDYTAVNKALSAITRKHKRISNKSTPLHLIKKKQGLDYVTLDYMKTIADKEFPGWSFEIVSDEYLYQQTVVNGIVVKFLIYYKIHGRLKWYDCGVMRTGDMAAAHRVQTKRTRDNYVDIGNDTKSAVTDCHKKAFNVYMNIADDVYKNQVEENVDLTDEQAKELTDLASKIDGPTHGMITMKIENGEISQLNYEGSKAKLERMIK